jgi:hypothetical protein
MPIGILHQSVTCEGFDYCLHPDRARRPREESPALHTRFGSRGLHFAIGPLLSFRFAWSFPIDRNNHGLIFCPFSTSEAISAVPCLHQWWTRIRINWRGSDIVQPLTRNSRALPGHSATSRQFPFVRYGHYPSTIVAEFHNHSLASRANFTPFSSLAFPVRPGQGYLASPPRGQKCRRRHLPRLGVSWPVFSSRTTGGGVLPRSPAAPRS